MIFNMNHKKYGNPKIYKKDGNEYLYDESREKMIRVQPEEIIRQKAVRFIMRRMDVPKSNIDIEVPLSRLIKGARGRADIVVYAYDDKTKPVLIVECKADHFPIIDDHHDQVCNYDRMIKARTIAVTNGHEFEIKTWVNTKRRYCELNKIPSFKELVKKQSLTIDSSKQTIWKRPSSITAMFDDDVIKFYKLFAVGEKTSELFSPFIVNLCSCLLDQKNKFIINTSKSLKIIEDFGLRNTSFGNASGGAWTGPYRTFLVNYKGNECLVGLSVLSCVNGFSYLVVSVDNYEERHNSLQLHLEKHSTYNFMSDKIAILHDGTMSVSNLGMAKKANVIKFVKKMAPDMIREDGLIHLGELPFGCQVITSKDKETKRFIANIIRYALIRDEFRFKAKTSAQN